MFDVRDTDVGNDANLRTSHPRQRRDLAGMIHAHLHDGKGVPLTTRQQSQRNANVVVEVSMGAPALQATPQNGIGEILGRGFSAGTGHPNHPDRQGAPPSRRKVLQTLESILHFHKARPVRSGSAARLNQTGRRPLPRDRIQKIMTVKPFTTERHKQIPRLNQAGIGHDPRNQGTTRDIGPASRPC
jgi:hypothetical protein